MRVRKRSTLDEKKWMLTLARGIKGLFEKEGFLVELVQYESYSEVRIFFKEKDLAPCDTSIPWTFTANGKIEPYLPKTKIKKRRT